jgi:UDP-3-O-[3-hydroxymyristoyl] glucosamine N-acyltransferase
VFSPEREGVFIHPTSEVHPTAVLGRGTKIWHLAQVRERAVIGENCKISKAFGLYIGSPGRLKGFVSRNGYEMTIVERESSRLVYECSRTKEKLTIRFEVE